MPISGQLSNYINGEWTRSQASEYMDVINPATAEPIAQVPLGNEADVAATTEDDDVEIGRQLRHGLDASRPLPAVT